MSDGYTAFGWESKKMGAHSIVSSKAAEGRKDVEMQYPFRFSPCVTIALTHPGGQDE